MQKCKCKGNSLTQGNLDTLQLTSESPLQKRQKRKAISHSIAWKLTQLYSPLQHQYFRSLRCSNEIKLKADNRIVTTFCGKRWCTVCSAIKQAELIEAYLPSLEAMAEPCHVTLTIPSVKAKALKSTMHGMPKIFARIKDSGRKKGLNLSGIRKIESNYKHEKKTFNPHYHILVDGEIEARYLQAEWLKRVKGAKAIAQDIKVADKGTLKELFKYQSKVVVGKKFNAKATDTILQAMNGIRTIQPFGKVKKARVAFDKESRQVITLSDTDKPLEAKIEPETVDSEPETIGIFTWHSEYNTWVNRETGEILIDSEIPEKHLSIIASIRDS